MRWVDVYHSIFGFLSNTDFWNSIWATKLYFVECRCDQQMNILLIKAFFNKILEIYFIEKTETKRELPQVPRTILPFPEVVHLPGFTPWLHQVALFQAKSFICARIFLPLPIIQGHCSCSSPLVSPSDLPTLLCHSHYCTNVL